MQMSAATQSATAAQAVTLCDGETIDAQAFSNHIARMLNGTTTTTGPSAAAVWMDREIKRS